MKDKQTQTDTHTDRQTKGESEILTDIIYLV
jgi:hypothetical protein